MTHVARLWHHRELLWFWTQREVRVRYKQSILGVAWAILQPAVLAFVFAVVFSFITRIPSDDIPYPLFAYSALVPWTLLATAVAMGIPSLVNQMNLVTKSAFPREILPLATIGVGLIDFAFSFAVYLIMLLVFGVPLTIYVIWLPLLLLLEFLLITGVVLFGSALNVFFRDIRFLVPLALQVWMFATPIIYPISIVPESIRPFYVLNPMVGIIESYRNIFVRGMPPTWELLAVGAVISTILLVTGWFFFKRLEPKFADVI